MLAILAIWCGLFGIVLGLGLWVRRLYDRSSDTGFPVFLTFWAGWAAASALVQLWHFIFPVGWEVGLVLCLLGITGYWGRIGKLRATLIGVDRGTLRTAIPTSIIAMWLAKQASQPPTTYDVGLYYLQTFRWTKEYPIVPGLANLHGRFGHISSHHLLAAALSAISADGNGYTWLNGLLLLVTTTLSISELAASTTSRWRRSSHSLYWIVLFLPLLSTCLTTDAPSATADLAIYLVEIVVVALLLRILDPAVARDSQKWNYFLIVILGSLGMTIKLSFAVFACASLAIAMWARTRPTKIRSKVQGALRAQALPMAGAAVLVLPWIFRNIVLTGYPLFPSTLLGQSLSWRVPKEHVTKLVMSVSAWARMPNAPPEQVMSNWNWIGPWLRSRILRDKVALIHTALPVALGLLSLGAGAAMPRTAHGRKFFRVWPCLVPPIASMIFWFFTAPDPRLAGSVFWVFSAVALAFFLGKLRARPWIRVAPIFWLAVASFLAIYPHAKRYPESLVNWSWRSPAYVPPPPALRETFRTQSGLELSVPVDDQCWDAALPCTPEPRHNLRLREVGNLKHGFYLAP